MVIEKLYRAVVIAFFAVCLGSVTAVAQFHNNGVIAFTSERDGNREIYTMNADGTDVVRLTNNNFVDDNPAWSPDGSKIAYLSQLPSGGFAVFTMNADGTGGTEITPITPPAYRKKIISWSPDGLRLVISQPNGLDIVDADGNNRRFLIFGFDPAWSPDGSKIAFVTPYTSGPGALYTVKPDGSGASVLIAAPPWGSVSAYPDWSPDGSAIAFVGGDNANQDMFVMDSDGSDFRFVVNECGGTSPGRSAHSPAGCGWINSLAWSPDGSNIVYAAFGKIYVVDGYGYGRIAISLTGVDSNPSWQPLISDVTISGRVTTPGGVGLRNAVVTLTDPDGLRRTTTTSSFGLYTFSNVPIDVTYTASLSSRRYRFAPRSITASGNLANVDFVGME